MHLGLIGGIGPAATVAYYDRLSGHFSGRVHDLTIVQADTATLIENATAGDDAAQVEIYLTLLDRLARAGATQAAITSITGHFCFDALAARAPLPLISIFDAINGALSAQGIMRIGVLGGTGVMATRVYDKLTADVVVPGDDLQALGALYFEIASSAACTPAQRTRFFEAGAALVAQGAEAILLGGTDLGLAFNGHDPGYAVIDAVDLHVAEMEQIALT